MRREVKTEGLLRPLKFYQVLLVSSQTSSSPLQILSSSFRPSSNPSSLLRVLSNKQIPLILVFGENEGKVKHEKDNACYTKDDPLE